MDFQLYVTLLFVNIVRISAQQCPDLPKLRFLPGSGWDALVNKPMNETTIFTYNQCKITNDGQYLIPDGTEAVLKKTTEFEVKGDLIEHWSNYTDPSASGFHVISDVWPAKYQSLYSSFSENVQKVKQILATNEHFVCRSQLRHLIYEIHVTPDAPMNESLKDRFAEAIAAADDNSTAKAEYLIETIVRDYGTHYTKSVDVGAIFVKIDLLPIAFLADHRHEKGKIVAASKLSLGSLGFRWRDKQYLDGSLLDSYDNAVVRTEYHVIGGPDWGSVTQNAEDWAAKTKKNLTLIDRSGDLLTGLITPLNFAGFAKTDLMKLENLLTEAIGNYYKRNIYKGCTQVTAPNFDYNANFDDGSCDIPTNEFVFGGMYTTCTYPVSGVGFCEYHFDNPLTNDASCPEDYESKLLLVRYKTFTYEERCVSDYYRNCKYVNVVTVNTYFCTGFDTSANNYEFGGLYSSSVDNVRTKKKNCPPFYHGYSLLDLTICVSNYKNASTKVYSIPFGGFISFKTNLFCPFGYERHFATKFDGNEVYYCIKELNWTNRNYSSTLMIQRPPFGNFSLDDEEVNGDALESAIKEGTENGYETAFWIVFIVLISGLIYWQRKAIMKYMNLIRNSWCRPPPDYQLTSTVAIVEKNDEKIDDQIA